MSDELERKIGYLIAEVENLTDRLEKIQVDTDKNNQLRYRISGGWAILAVLGSAVSFVLGNVFHVFDAR